jgi:hypothetical protein
LLSRCEALSLNPSTAKKRRERHRGALCAIWQSYRHKGLWSYWFAMCHLTSVALVESSHLAPQVTSGHSENVTRGGLWRWALLRQPRMAPASSLLRLDSISVPKDARSDPGGIHTSVVPTPWMMGPCLAGRCWGGLADRGTLATPPHSWVALTPRDKHFQGQNYLPSQHVQGVSGG